MFVHTVSAVIHAAHQPCELLSSDHESPDTRVLHTHPKLSRAALLFGRVTGGTVWRTKKPTTDYAGTNGACQGSCTKQCDFEFDQRQHQEQQTRNVFTATITIIKLKPSEL